MLSAFQKCAEIEAALRAVLHVAGMISLDQVVTGKKMFVLRSLFWLSTLVMLLPPTTEGGPAPRVSVLHAVYAARVLAQDITGVCERNPEACATSRTALVLLSRKLETGAGIVASGIAVGQGDIDLFASEADRGTLNADDLAAPWSVAEAGY